MEERNWFGPLISVCFLAFVAILGIVLFCPGIGESLKPWSGLIGTFLGAVIGFAGLGWAALYNAKINRDLTEAQFNREMRWEKERLDDELRAAAQLLDQRVFEILGQLGGAYLSIQKLEPKTEEDRQTLQEGLSKYLYLPDFDDLTISMGRMGYLPEAKYRAFFTFMMLYRTHIAHWHPNGAMDDIEDQQSFDIYCNALRELIEHGLAAHSQLCEFAGITNLAPNDLKGFLDWVLAR